MLSSENPPLPLPGERFDVLYAVSVLTHLDEHHQDAWLEEWRRMVKPGGLALVTYRGEGFLAKAESQAGPQRRERIEELWGEDGFGFSATDFWEGVFPAFYGGAYHRDSYVREHWGRTRNNFLARTGESKDSIRAYVEHQFGYDLSQRLDDIRPGYRFDVSCQGSVPQALLAFLEADDYEHAVRLAISLGGDSDTIACITGGVAQAYYGGVPDSIRHEALGSLDDRLRAVVEEFEARYNGI